MAMKVLWAAVLLAYGASTGAAMAPGDAASSSSPLLTLDMALDSVDDMYDGCRDKMAEKVETYLEKEKSTNADFKKAWDNGFPLKENNPVHAAIYVYTSQHPNIYGPLNRAVHDEGPNYTTSFEFHALHFYLTTAIQTLHKKNKCFTVSRRSKQPYEDVAKNTQVRFGNFASTTKKTLKDTKVSPFGAETCFKIFTCMGADISGYSAIENEAEVLIPPYEVFKVTDKKKRSKKKRSKFLNCFRCKKKYPDLPCDVVYTLKSTKKHVSNLNCALFKKSTKAI